MAMKQINFYNRYRAAAMSTRAARRTKALLWAAPALVVVLVCLGAWAGLCAHTAALNSRADALYAWCNDPVRLTPYAQYLADLRQGNRDRSLAASAADMTDLLDSYPRVTGHLLNHIAAVGGSGIRIRFSGYDAATGALTFDVSSRAVLDIPAYIRALEDCGVFARVAYTGYAAGDGIGGDYTVNLSCILAAPEEAAP